MRRRGSDMGSAYPRIEAEPTALYVHGQQPPELLDDGTQAGVVVALDRGAALVHQLLGRDQVRGRADLRGRALEHPLPGRRMAIERGVPQAAHQAELALE